MSWVISIFPELLGTVAQGQSGIIPLENNLSDNLCKKDPVEKIRWQNEPNHLFFQLYKLDFINFKNIKEKQVKYESLTILALLAYLQHYSEW